MSDLWKSLKDKKTYDGYGAVSKRVSSSDPKQEMRSFLSGGYTVENLVEDDYYTDIESHMVDKYGTHMNTYDRPDVVDMYLNDRRGVSGGNSVRVASDIRFISAADEGELERAGRAYAIFEGLPSIFSEESTWANTGEALVDYGRAAILDPVNLLGGLIGKSISSGGFKGLGVAANITARNAYRASMTKSIARGVTEVAAKTTAQEVGEKVLSGAVSDLATKQAANALWRNTTIKGVKNKTLAKIAKPGVMIEAGTMTAIDTAAAGATDYAYQTGLLETGVIDDRSLVQTGLTMLGTVILAGTFTTLGLAKSNRSVGEVSGPDLAHMVDQRKGAEISVVSSTMSSTLKDSVKRTPYGKWVEDIQNGVEVGDLDTSFWLTMILGNDKTGAKGLVHTLSDQGRGWVPIDDNDTISNFLGDVIKYADEVDYEKFVDDFTGNSEVAIKGIRELGQEGFADTFKRKVADSLKVGNALSQASKTLGVDKKNLRVIDLWEYMSEGMSGGNWTKSIEKHVPSKLSRTIPHTQGQVIRLLVSNLATTQLNLLGWSVSSAMDTTTDLVSATLMAPFSAGVKSGGFGKGSTFRQAYRSAFDKIANTVDVNTTYDQFRNYTLVRSKQLAELTSILPGGVESGKKLYSNLELDIPIASMRADQVINTIQDLSLVRSQDAYSKSIEFMTAMQKGIRKEYGVEFGEFFDISKNPDYWKKMATPEFQMIERNSVTTALDNIFSRSYGKKPNVLGEVADIIEKTRNIPLVGLYMPFGRFFNNTIAFMSDYSGMSLLMKSGKKLVGENIISTDSYGKTLTRTAVGWSIIGSLALREDSFIDMGLTWDEQPQLGSVTGAITSEKYNFPYAPLKAAARLVAMKLKGIEVPDSMVEDILNTLGPESFTRSFTDTFGQSWDDMVGIINSDQSAVSTLGRISSKLAGQTVASSTRFLEPINSAIGVMQGRDRVIQDRRQGMSNVKNGTRYMDNIIGLLGGEYNEQRHSPVRGKQRPQDSKLFSPVREVKTTNMSRLAAIVGIDEWDKKITMIGASAPEASNKYAEIYNEVNEHATGILLNSDKFKRAPLETKRVYANRLLKKNKAFVLNYMESNWEGDTVFLSKVSKMTNLYTEKQIMRVSRELGYETDNLMELSDEQLSDLNIALSVRSEMLEYQNQ